MKRFIILLLILFTVPSLLLVNAQEHKANKVINTLKERISLSGYLQMGYTYDNKEEEAHNTFSVNRAVLIVKGKVTDKWSCMFMYSMANTSKILEAYTDYKFNPHITLRAGQFKLPFTMENQISACYTDLVSCQSQAVSYMAGRNRSPEASDYVYGSNAGRDIGVMIFGDLFDKYLSYKLAVMNGQGINKKDMNNQKDIMGMAVVHPTKWLDLSGSFTTGTGYANAASEFIPNVAKGDNYKRTRWSAGAWVKTKAADIRSEYLQAKFKDAVSRGYYCTTSIHVTPKLDLIASYDYLNRNTDMSAYQTNYVAGAQYWFYPMCKFQLQYSYCNPNLGEHYNLLQTQIQIRF